MKYSQNTSTNTYDIKNFSYLAWASFIYRCYGFDKDYYSIIELPMFRNLSGKITISNDNEFIRILMQFLNKWRCRAANNIGYGLLDLIKDNIPLFEMLYSKKLYTLSDNDIEIANNIYNNFIEKKGNGIKVAIAAKSLHIINPDVFVLADNKIFQKVLETLGAKMTDTFAYGHFLKYCQIQITSIENNKKIFDEKIARLSKRLYPDNKIKTAAKIIDEYFWVRINKEKISIPPDWHPGQFL